MGNAQSGEAFNSLVQGEQDHSASIKEPRQHRLPDTHAPVDKQRPGYTVRLDPVPDNTEGRDLILSTFGVRALQKFGYIDYLSGQQLPRLEAHFVRPNALYITRAGTVPAGFLRNPFHPIFKRENFRCSDFEYVLLQPALQLASGILNEPALQTFLGGILAHDTHKPIQGFQGVSFDNLPDVTQEQYKLNIWRKVASLEHCITFSINLDLGENANFAVTSEFYAPYEASGARYGLVDGTTFPQAVEIEKLYKEAFSDSAPAQSLPYVKTFDQDALKLRTHFLIAASLVHEIAHALWAASKQWLPNTDHRFEPADPYTGDLKPMPPEPFYRDHRVAELGFALGSILFDGMIHPIGNYEESISNRWLSCPVYGLCIARFPGQFDNRQIHVGYRGSPAQYGVRFAAEYPLAMDWVHRFFTPGFWQKTVPQYRLKAYHPRRWHGVRETVPGLGEGEQLLISPGRQVQSPLPPKEGSMDSPPPPIDDFDPYTAPADVARPRFVSSVVTKRRAPFAPLDRRGGKRLRT